MTKERKHSKFSASGAERWFNCPGSVELSEGQPDKSSVWAEEGTKAHEVLEKVLKALDPNVFGENNAWIRHELPKTYNREMIQYALEAAIFIRDLQKKNPNSEVLVETRIHLDFIHPEMFGTFDGAVIDHFGTLHVFDYKYGAGHSVAPKENLQMIFYGIGLAHLHHWNFKRVRLWIIQPRIKGYDGPAFWEIPIQDLKDYVYKFKKKVLMVEKYPNKYAEGAWCWWCKAKSVCPLKIQNKMDSAIEIFKVNPIDKKTDIDDFY
jgi:hypothetical protein